MDIAGASAIFLKSGLLGAFVVVLIAAIIVLWLAYQKQVSRNQEMGNTMIELSTKLTFLVEDIYAYTKAMPTDVKDKITPDLKAIQKTVDEIKNRLQ